MKSSIKSKIIGFTLAMILTCTPFAQVKNPDSSGSNLPSASVALGKLTLNDGGRERSFSIAMDELVRKLPSWIEESISLAPQNNISALHKIWNQMQRKSNAEVFPVAYEDGVTRNFYTRRLITPQIRIELKNGANLAATITGAIELKRMEYAPGFVLVRMRDSFAALNALTSVRMLPDVQRADILLAKQQTSRTLPNDPLIHSQWHIKNTGQGGGIAGTDINVELVWNYGGMGGYRGAGIIVGIVDNGLETTHPDLTANVRTDIDHDWNDNTPDDPDPVPGDASDHGTLCAGNVAAVGNNLLGICGSAPEAKIVGLRLTASSHGDEEDSEAIAWRNDVIHIKSCSWGPPDGGYTLEGPGMLTNLMPR